ncbi:hypothetical protein HDV02_002985 [Globomyces sp. JEL0801]|nr:hypothetical protein HDV02_002985 [Globomyces sp. JEL0801]
MRVGKKILRYSGLTAAVSESKISTQEAQELVVEFLKTHVPHAKVAVLAGNSVHVDRQFLCQEMPDLIQHLHYRIVDVSTIKELSRRWYPDDHPPKKGLAHRLFYLINFH